MVVGEPGIEHLVQFAVRQSPELELRNTGRRGRRNRCGSLGGLPLGLGVGLDGADDQAVEAEVSGLRHRHGSSRRQSWSRWRLCLCLSRDRRCVWACVRVALIWPWKVSPLVFEVAPFAACRRRGGPRHQRTGPRGGASPGCTSKARKTGTPLGGAAPRSTTPTAQPQGGPHRNGKPSANRHPGNPPKHGGDRDDNRPAKKAAGVAHWHTYCEHV